MTSQQRLLVRGLIKKYAEDSGMEYLLIYVAESRGMLAACQAMLVGIKSSDVNTADWLQLECERQKVVLHSFLQDVAQLNKLFNADPSVSDHHTTLGVAADAGIEEIKYAYRKLSLIYHPDTASSNKNTNTENFIAINKAYHALLAENDNGHETEPPDSKTHWQKRKKRGLTYAQQKTFVIWACVLLVLLVSITTIGSMHLKKRAMLAGLQTAGVAFVPPAKKSQPKPIDTIDQSSITISQVEPVEMPVSSKEARSQTPAEDIFAKEQPEQLVLVKDTQASGLPRQTISEHKDVDTRPLNVTTLSIKKEILVGSPVQSSPLLPPKKLIAEEKVRMPLVAETSTPASRTPQSFGKRMAEQKQLPREQKQLPTTEQKQLPETVPVAVESTEQLSAVEPPLVKVAAPSAQIDTIMRQTVPEQPDLQSRIDLFLQEYLNAYNQRDFKLFSRFFTEDAQENDKPFGAMQAVYKDLFATTSTINLYVKKNSWKKTDGGLSLEGRFLVEIHYTDNRTVVGSGPIRFQLVPEGDGFLIQTLVYEFHSDK